MKRTNQEEQHNGPNHIIKAAADVAMEDWNWRGKSRMAHIQQSSDERNKEEGGTAVSKTHHDTDETVKSKEYSTDGNYCIYQIFVSNDLRLI